MGSDFIQLQYVLKYKPYLIRCQFFVPNKKVIDFHFSWNIWTTPPTNPEFFTNKG